MNKYTIVFLSAITLLQCKSEEGTTKMRPANSDTTVVEVTLPQLGENSGKITAIAAVINGAEAKPSFKTGGVIANTLVSEGQNVKKGQLLARLNLAEIDAQLSQANEAAKKAERDLSRARRLLADSVATLEQVQNATTALEVAKKTVDILNFNKQYSEVRSPINGRVVKQILHEGEMAGPGMPVYVIIGTNNNDWKVKAGFIDKDWIQIKNGQSASLILDAQPGKSYDMYVYEKSIIAGNANGLVDIEFKFKNQPSDLAAGLLGKIHLQLTNDTKELSLPIESLTRSSGNTSFVFIHQNGVVKEQAITTGQLLGNRVQVISGLKADDEVVTIGAMYLEDGDAIKINR